jgi:hypothetical protein
MAITKADILAAVNENLGLSLSGTAIDRILSNVLADLTSRGDFLAGSQTITTEAGTTEYSLADDCKGVSRVLYNGEELDHVSISDVDRVNSGMPEGWAMWNRKLAIHPKPAGAYSLTVEMFRIHPRTPDAIELSSRFQEALEAAVTARYARSKERFDESTVWDNEYEKALLSLNDSQVDRVRTVKYREW